jgi:hypothetical protein
MGMALDAAEGREEVEEEDMANNRRNGFLVAPRLPVAPR